MASGPLVFRAVLLARGVAVKAPLQRQLICWSSYHSRAVAWLPRHAHLGTNKKLGVPTAGVHYGGLDLQSPCWLQCSLYTNGPEKAGAGEGATMKTGSAAVAKLSNTQRIKVVLKEYGTVAFVFHMSMSLFSVGMCYLLVKNGLDVDKLLTYFNFESSAAKKGTSTFAIAYILHKALLPLRATITVVSVPIIVRQLRARGWMKKPLPGSSSTS